MSNPCWWRVSLYSDNCGGRIVTIMVASPRIHAIMTRRARVLAHEVRQTISPVVVNASRRRRCETSWQGTALGG